MSKYGAIPTFVDGIRFDSKREATRYSQLKLLERAGAIRQLELQPAFAFSINGRPVLARSKGYPKGRQLKMVADFRYFDVQKDRLTWEDTKGFRTKDFIVKKAFFECLNPGVVLEEV